MLGDLGKSLEKASQLAAPAAQKSLSTSVLGGGGVYGSSLLPARRPYSMRYTCVQHPARGPVTNQSYGASAARTPQVYQKINTGYPQTILIFVALRGIIVYA